MKNHVITVTFLVGRRLLAKARIEASEDTTEVTGVTLGNQEIAAELATISSLYAANLFTERKEVAQETERLVRIYEPSSEVVIAGRPGANQPSLPSVGEDDIPF